MSRKKVNMTDVQEGGTFTLVPEGIQTLRVDEVKDTVSQNGDDMYVVKLVCDSGPGEGAWLWDNIVVSDNPTSPGYKILGRTKHFLHCIGEPYEGNIEIDTDSWLDKLVKVDIFHDTFTNKAGKKSTKAKVKQYLLDEEIPNTSPEEETPFN